MYYMFFKLGSLLLRIPALGYEGTEGTVPKPVLYIGAGVVGCTSSKLTKVIQRPSAGLFPSSQYMKHFSLFMLFICRKKWANVEKDKVILHQLSRGSVTPSPSPFVLKLETYLRMANIPYKVLNP